MKIDKPAYGSPCNSCGQCCEDKLCPLAAIAAPRWKAPCPALMRADAGKKVCGLVANPARYLPIRCASLGVLGPKAVSTAAKVLIGVDVGCDALLVGEPYDPAVRARIRLKADSIPHEVVKAAVGIFNIPASILTKRSRK